jgi:zinc protease
MGNQASNTEMTPADLRAFYTSYYQPQNAHLIVVGDVTAATLLPKLEKVFGSWKNGTMPAKPVVAAATQHGPRQIYLVDKPGAPQSQIRIGWGGGAIHGGLLRARCSTRCWAVVHLAPELEL